jgi:predicted ThiF/HesA family dinucleotide-utilizing enzyme
MGQMTTPKPLINIVWTCQEMMVWMSRELISSMDVIWYGFGSEVGQIKADFCDVLATNMTQHDSHGPDDHPKTID